MTMRGVACIMLAGVHILVASSTAGQGPCAQKQAEMTSLMESTHNLLLGIEQPRCDDQGFYIPMQIAGPEAYCVTKNGTSLAYMGYQVDVTEAHDMNCQCALDQYEYLASGQTGKTFLCQPNGNYMPAGRR